MNRFGIRGLAALVGCGVLLASSATFAAPSANGVLHRAVCPGPASKDHARCHARVVVHPDGKPVANTTPRGFLPADLRLAYNVTGSGSPTTTIAIVDAYGYPGAESDLGVYRAKFGLPACTTANGCFKKVDQNGGTTYPRADTGWSQETALDLDMASAMCPNCKLLLVESNSAYLTDLAAAVKKAGTLGAHVISNSYGGSESGSTTYESSYNIANVAVVASTGDNGYGVSFPASSPHVIAVGGTSLKRSTDARGWSETAWAGAGSGCSTVYGKPVWQTDAGCTKRALADVSAVADPNTGVAVYGPATRTGSGWMVFGGTSASAPLIGGIYGVNGGTVNGGEPYYATAGAINDVKSGSNGSCSVAYLCNAGVGYDGPTGLGTPNGITGF